MNCPTCGAKNDADARFCAECGTPLEDQEAEAARADQAFDEADSDATIMSTSAQFAEETKTVAVDQEQVSAALEQEGSDSPAEAELELESAPPSPPEEPASAGGGDDEGPGVLTGGANGEGRNRTLIIVGAIVVVLLCCCCFSLAVGGAIGSDPGTFEDIIDELSMLSNFLLVV